MDGINTDNMLGYIQQMVDFGSRYAHPDTVGIDNVEPALIALFQSFGYENAYKWYAENLAFSPMNGFGNIIAYITGCKYPEEQIIIGAHWDSFSSTPYTDAPGATDNASGCGVVLEIARAIKASNLAPERTIKFILWANEEVGRPGSYNYVDIAKKNGDNIVLYINADMVGIKRDPALNLPDVSYTHRYGIDIDKNLRIINTFSKYVPELNVIKYMDEPYPPDNPIPQYYPLESDNVPFDDMLYDNINFCTLGFHPYIPEYTWSHTPNDTLDKIDPINLKKCANACMSVLAEFAGMSILRGSQITLTLTETTTVKARAFKTGYADSDIIEKTYVI